MSIWDGVRVWVFVTWLGEERIRGRESVSREVNEEVVIIWDYGNVLDKRGVW